jgi:hypothetical protein
VASHLRPPLLLVGFPERQHGIPIHPADLQRSSLTQFRSIHPSAWRRRTASVQRVRPQNQWSISSRPTDTPVGNRSTPRVRSDQQKGPFALMPPPVTFQSHWLAVPTRQRARNVSADREKFSRNIAGDCSDQLTDLRDDVAEEPGIGSYDRKANP